MLSQIDASQFTAGFCAVDFPRVRVSEKVGRIVFVHELCLHISLRDAQILYLFRVQIDGELDMVLGIPYLQWLQMDGREAELLAAVVLDLSQDGVPAERLWGRLLRGYARAAKERFDIILQP